MQNLLALRFGNVLFEPLWRREWISDVQITIAEKIGPRAQNLDAAQRHTRRRQQPGVDAGHRLAVFCAAATWCTRSSL